MNLCLTLQSRNAAQICAVHASAGPGRLVIDITFVQGNTDISAGSSVHAGYSDYSFIFIQKAC